MEKELYSFYGFDEDKNQLLTLTNQLLTNSEAYALSIQLENLTGLSVEYQS